MKNEERWRMDEERRRTFTKLVIETLRKHYGSTSVLIFFFFILFFTNFKWNMLAKGAEPLPLSLPHLFIAKIGEELATQLAQASWWLSAEATCSPRWAGCFMLKLPDGPSAEEHPLNWSFHHHFEFFSSFPSETSQNLTGHAKIGFKQLNMTDKNLHIDKQLSPDEIRVWQLC